MESTATLAIFLLLPLADLGQAIAEPILMRAERRDCNVQFGFRSKNRLLPNRKGFKLDVPKACLFCKFVTKTWDSCFAWGGGRGGGGRFPLEKGTLVPQNCFLDSSWGFWTEEAVIQECWSDDSIAVPASELEITSRGGVSKLLQSTTSLQFDPVWPSKGNHENRYMGGGREWGYQLPWPSQIEASQCHGHSDPRGQDLFLIWGVDV